MLGTEFRVSNMEGICFILSTSSVLNTAFLGGSGGTPVVLRGIIRGAGDLKQGHSCCIHVQHKCLTSWTTSLALNIAFYQRLGKYGLL